LFRVLTTVKFYKQTAIGAAKVNNVRTYRMLASKFGPAELSIAQAQPEFSFDISLLLAQLARSVSQLLRAWHALTLPSPTKRGRGF